MGTENDSSDLPSHDADTRGHDAGSGAPDASSGGDDDEVLVAAPAADGSAPRPEGARGPRGGGGRGRGPRGPGGPGGGPPREGGPRGPRGGGPPRNAPRVSLEPLTRLVAHLAKALVDRPDEVAVREVHGDRFPRIELQVAPDDIGKVIGKDGRTAQCMRALLQAAAARTGARAHLDIVD